METQKRLMELKWELSAEPDQALVSQLASELSLPPVAVRILINRGIDTKARAEEFLTPSLENLMDPFVLQDMEKGVDRIIRALRNREKIMIFGDYDVDGITSTSLLFLILNKLGGEVTYYLPNRLIEGYGLSEEGIQEAQRRGVKLIVTVDCGITAEEEIAFAKGKGIDTIVTDHHEPKDILPDASAIINPKAAKDQYPGGELSGVGVAFKLAQAIYTKLAQDEGDLEEHLDLVALGTTADIVPLVGENRILTKFGMAQIARTNKPGLKSLIFVCGLLGQRIGTGQVVFILAPRINAVGRLGDADLAIKLLTTRDESKAAEMARVLDKENRRRKTIDETTLREALEMVENEVDLTSDKAIVLASSGWHQGVIGIVASRLVERYHRPTVMIAIEGEEGKGSARSIRGFDLYEAIIECEEHLIRYGGHKYAAGLSISPEEVEPFRKKFKKVSGERLSPEDLIPRLTIDAELDLDQVNPELIRILDLFAPFGPQNMRPVFVSRSLRVWGQPYVVGNNHLRMRVKKEGPVFDCIGFGMGDLAKILCMKGIRVDLAYVAETNFWNDTYKIQLRIKDLKISDHII